MGKRLHFFILFILSFIFQVNVQSQLSNTEKSDFLDAEYYLDLGDYNKAVKLYVKLINTKPDNANFNYRAGQSYLNIPGDEGNALPYLEKAVKNIDNNYTAGNFKSEAAPADAWILLGDAYHRVNRLDDASNAYNKYLAYVGNDQVAQDIVYRRINGLALTRSGLEKPAPVTQKNIGGIVNSKYSDYNPVLSLDQKTLVFTSYRDSKDRILTSTYANGSWGSPVDITAQLGSAGDYFCTAISADGNELYLCNYDPVNSDIFVALKERGRWAKSNPLEKPINTKYHETSASISRDGDILYFSSDRPGGKGGFDIYSSTRGGDGKWSKPVNLGGKVNTIGDEENPYITPDGNTLYFSSDGHESIGKKDILFSQQNKDGVWQQPVNLGVPYNTPDDELSYIYFPDTKTGYISRNLPNGFGKKDLYLLIPKEKGAQSPMLANEPDSKNNEAPFTPEPVIKTETQKATTTVVAEKPASVSVKPTQTPVVSVQPVQKNVQTETPASKPKSEPVASLPAVTANPVGVVSAGVVTTTAAATTQPVQKPAQTETPATKPKSEPVSQSPEVTTQPVQKPVQTVTPAAKPKNEQLAQTPVVTTQPVQKTTTAEPPSSKPKNEPATQSPKVEPLFAEKTTATTKPTQPAIKEIPVAKPKEEKSVVAPKPTSENIQKSLPTSVSVKSSKVEGGSYTIQIMALKVPTESSRFSRLEKSKLKISKGADGYCRYTYGVYPSKQKAIEELRKVVVLGFRDAYIRDIKDISNY